MNAALYSTSPTSDDYDGVTIANTVGSSLKGRKKGKRAGSIKFAYEPMRYPELDEIRAEAKEIHTLISRGKIVEAMSLIDPLTQKINLLP